MQQNILSEVTSIANQEVSLKNSQKSTFKNTNIDIIVNMDEAIKQQPVVKQQLQPVQPIQPSLVIRSRQVSKAVGSSHNRASNKFKKHGHSSSTTSLPSLKGTSKQFVKQNLSTLNPVSRNNTMVFKGNKKENKFTDSNQSNESTQKLRFKK